MAIVGQNPTNKFALANFPGPHTQFALATCSGLHKIVDQIPGHIIALTLTHPSGPHKVALAKLPESRSTHYNIRLKRCCCFLCVVDSIIALMPGKLFKCIGV